MRTKNECDICKGYFHKMYYYKDKELDKMRLICGLCFRLRAMSHFKCLICKKKHIQDFNLSGLCSCCFKKEYPYNTPYNTLTDNIFIDKLIKSIK
jgi:hypothetical protein